MTRLSMLEPSSVVAKKPTARTPDGVVDERRHRCRQLNAQHVAVEPAEALDGAVREPVVEQDRGLAQDVVPVERRDPEDRGIEVHLEIGADQVALGQERSRPVSAR